MLQAKEGSSSILREREREKDRQREIGPSGSRRGGDGKRMDIDDVLEGEKDLDFATERSAERREREIDR